MVVAWHWVFTIIIWEADGPHASNPIGFTQGLWIATWAFQVMPVFFYVGGYGHLRSWQKAQETGMSIWVLVGSRLRRLAIPAFGLIGVWIIVGIVTTAVWDVKWFWQAIKLVISPLWFMGVYLVLVALLPVALWLHRRFDSAVIVVLAGLAGIVDIVRFRYNEPWFGLFNMVLVWGLCHQLGFFYERIANSRRAVNWTLLLGGMFGLAGFVGSGIYPGSMVGVPGELSNMAPPTLCIVALVFFQAGLIEVIRPWVESRLGRPRWARVSDVINRFSLPLFLFHSTGMALSRGISYVIQGRDSEATEPTLVWWLARPLAFVLPLLCTMPVIYLFGRYGARRSHTKHAAT